MTQIFNSNTICYVKNHRELARSILMIKSSLKNNFRFWKIQSAQRERGKTTCTKYDNYYVESCGFKVLWWRVNHHYHHRVRLSCSNSFWFTFLKLFSYAQNFVGISQWFNLLYKKYFYSRSSATVESSSFCGAKSDLNTQKPTSIFWSKECGVEVRKTAQECRSTN